ncbi:large subunit ribosomal protein L28 [Candidatus Vidania fulgoroideae]|uniref:Large subunit ribosomal protein L28 n=1 Tax=Candidatus Vidania fulgoroideorum TaxID=881286 RepID=A0A346E0E1_9PROT|nr:large subunit ribosomal protein L28 [Candidatus Vidania fulgoroideae]
MKYRTRNTKIAGLIPAFGIFFMIKKTMFGNKKSKSNKKVKRVFKVNKQIYKYNNKRKKISVKYIKFLKKNEKK